MDDSHNLQDKGRGCSSDSDVEAGVKKIILVFEEPEFEAGVAGAGLDLADAANADAVDGDLQTEKDRKGDEVGEVHGGFTPGLDFSGGRGIGETQTITGQSSGGKKGWFENRPEEKGQKKGLGQAGQGFPWPGAGEGKIRNQAPSGLNQKPGPTQKEEATEKLQDLFPAKKKRRPCGWIG